MSKVLLRQTILYLLVGGMVYAVDLWAFTTVVLIWPEQYLVGNSVGKLLGAAFGFLLHKYMTFAGMHRYSGVQQALAYISLLAGNIVVGTILIYALVDMLALPKIPARIAVDIAIIVSTFFINRNRVFRHAAGHPPEDRTSSEKGFTT